MNAILGLLLGISFTFNVLYVISYKNMLKTCKKSVEKKKKELEEEYAKWGKR